MTISSSLISLFRFSNSGKAVFYHSAVSLELEPIDRNIYVEFASEHFLQSGRTIDRAAVIYAYDRFRGITMHIHRVLHDSFAETEREGLCTVSDMERICEDYIIECGSRLKELLSNDYITKVGNIYSISDPIMDIWLREIVHRKK